MISGLVLAAAVMAAGSCEGPFDAGQGRIGTLRTGTVEQITAGPQPYRRTNFTDEGGDHYEYVVTVCPGVQIEAYVDIGKTDIYQLSTSSSAYVTAEGAHVGMTVAELKAVYPRGELHYAEVEGRYAGFATGRGLTFTIDYSGIPDDCFHANYGKCDRLFLNKRSQSLFTN